MAINWCVVGVCEIGHFDRKGRVVSGGCYYDQYPLLTSSLKSDTSNRLRWQRKVCGTARC